MTDSKDINNPIRNKKALDRISVAVDRFLRTLGCRKRNEDTFNNPHPKEIQEESDDYADECFTDFLRSLRKFWDASKKAESWGDEDKKVNGEENVFTIEANEPSGQPHIKDNGQGE